MRQPLSLCDHQYPDSQILFERVFGSSLTLSARHQRQQHHTPKSLEVNKTIFSFSFQRHMVSLAACVCSSHAMCNEMRDVSKSYSTLQMDNQIKFHSCECERFSTLTKLIFFYFFFAAVVVVQFGAPWCGRCRLVSRHNTIDVSIRVYC